MGGNRRNVTLWPVAYRRCLEGTVRAMAEVWPLTGKDRTTESRLSNRFTEELPLSVQKMLLSIKSIVIIIPNNIILIKSKSHLIRKLRSVKWNADKPPNISQEVSLLSEYL